MKVNIVHFFGTRNIGDFAMLRGLMKIINKNVQLRIYSDGNIEEDATKLNETICSSISKTVNVAYGKAVFIVIFLSLFLFKNSLVKLIFKMLRKEAQLNSLLDCDYGFTTGGPFIVQNDRIKFEDFRLNHMYYLFDIKLMQNANISCFIIGQSFSEYKGSVPRFFTKRILSKCVLFPREWKSFEKLTTFLDNNTNIIQIPDLAFMNKLASDGHSQERYIVVNIRELNSKFIQFLSKKYHINSEKAYLDILKNLILDFLQANDKFEVILLCHSIDDYNISQTFNTSLNNRCSIHVPKSLEEALIIYKNAEFAISTRYHSYILATTQGTPFFTIPYSEKVEVSLKDYKLDFLINFANEVEIGRSFNYFLSIRSSLREQLLNRTEFNQYTLHNLLSTHLPSGTHA